LPETFSTPLAKKLGAKPGAEVVVFFTTRRVELERRFVALKKTLAPADGLWIAWPKKASELETDLDFAAVQEIGLAAGLVDNKSTARRIDPASIALVSVACAEEKQWGNLPVSPFAPSPAHRPKVGL
jgi:hypothetical protein